MNLLKFLVFVMERDNWEPRYASVLIINLAEKAIESQMDCSLLWDEIETLHDDYPDYKLIVFKL